MNTKQTELSQDMKKLYRHWNFHISPDIEPLKLEQVCQDKKLFEEVSWFVKERIEIWKKKVRGDDHPLTKDSILQRYKFCNIFREFDRQTIEFHTLLYPMRDDLPLWLLNMFYCRMVARLDTIKQTGLLSFDPRQNKLVYEKLINLPRPVYGNAYVFPISVIQQSLTPTRELFITEHLPHVMKEVASEIAGWRRKPVYDGVEMILPIFGYNMRFHWTEVLIDTAYQFPGLIDLFGRFPIGPGATPTLSRINSSKDPSQLVVDLSKLDLYTGITYENKHLALSAENWEGIACEFRKYSNLKGGKGRRRIYKRDI